MTCLNLVTDCGADPTGQANALPAFQEAMDAFAQETPAWTGANQGRHGGSIYLPTGRYRIDGELVIDRAVTIWCDHGGRNPTAVLEHVAESARSAVFVATSGDDINNPSGAWSTIRNVGVRSMVSGGNASGILMHAPARVEGVRVQDFARDCIEVDGTRIQGEPKRNCNRYAVRDAYLKGAGRYGFSVCGEDANAGNLHAVETGGCGVAGFYDSAFLGSTNYIGCYSEVDNGAHFVHDGPSNRTLYLGCYTEGPGVTAATLDKLGVWISGVAGGPVEGDGLAILNGQQISGLQTYNSDGSETIRTAFGRGPDAVMRWQGEEDEYEWSVAKKDGWYHVLHGNTTAWSALRFRRNGSAIEVSFPKATVDFPKGWTSGAHSVASLVARLEALENA